MTLKKVDILPSANDITYRRMKKAAEELRKNSSPSPLIEILLGEGKPGSEIVQEQYRKLQSDSEKLKNLNEEQLEAVHRSISHPELFVLHGPPGTGKTTTISAIVTEQVARNGFLKPYHYSLP